MTRLCIAMLSDPAPGETECGDVALHLPLPLPPASEAGDQPPDAHWLALIDGLGHGPAAAHAAHTAADTLRQAAQRAVPAPSDLPAQLEQLDRALVATRGAAVGLMWLRGTQLRYAGVGNTRALRWRAGQVLRLPSHYGVVGDGQSARGAAGGTRRQAQPLQATDVAPGDWLLLFSDGLDEGLHIDTLWPEWHDNPQALCQHLMAHWRHARDDAAVLACQVQP